MIRPSWLGISKARASELIKAEIAAQGKKLDELQEAEDQNRGLLVARIESQCLIGMQLNLGTNAFSPVSQPRSQVSCFQRTN